MSADRCKPFRTLVTFVLAALLLAFTPPLAPAQSSIGFVQQNSADPQTPQASVAVAYTLAQTAGNLNVVVVGWNDSTATLSSVSDTQGNVYSPALAPTVQTGTATQVIYYAKNIAGAAAGANTVTVTFSAAANFPDIRIAEYTGVDPVSPLDGAVGAQGNSLTADSGALTTTNANDLLVGASVVQTLTTGPGAGFTSRVVTNPDGDILEDQTVTAVGTYNATAPVSPSGLWIMQIAAFRAAGSGGGAAPTISSVNPTSGSVGQLVTITGTNFGSAQGTSTVTFNGVAATPTSWSAASIAVPVPAGASSGNVVVTVGGTSSNGFAFTVTTAPSINSLNPTSGPVGQAVTITGTNFGSTQGTSTVTFNGVAATPTSWSAASIVAPVPTGATSGNVIVTVGGAASNAVAFTVTASAPNIASLNPSSGQVGQSVTITGSNFGGTQGTSTVTFNGVSAAPSSWSDTSILAPVPAGATSGNVVVTVNGAASNGVAFTVQSASSGIKLVQHTSKDAGTTISSTLAFTSNNTAGNFIAVVIRAGRSGQVFKVTDSRGNTYKQAVQFNATNDPPNGDTLGIFYAEGITAGANTVTVANSVNGTLRFAILEYSGVLALNSLDVTVANMGTSNAPNSGPATTTAAGDLLLGAIMTGNGQTFIGGPGYTVEDRVPSSGTKLISEDQIQASAGAASASATLSSSDAWAAALAAFKAATAGAPAPSISNLNPNSGSVGTSVTISGANFGATQGTSSVKFNTTTATPTSWSANSIVVPVPAGATSGNVVVTVGGLASNPVAFTVTVPPPSISGINPTSGPIGTSVTISGSNFGTTQGTSSVTFNTVTATPTSWSSGSIVVPVPNGATTGSVFVTVAGVNSNGITFTVTSVGPSITSLSNASGPVGALITITGVNFGATQGTSAVTFNGVAGTPSVWGDTSINVPVPVGATTGNVVVTVSGVQSNGVLYTVTPPPNITSINPSAGPIGTVVNVAGANFGATVGTRSSVLSFNGIAARTTSWSDTLIVAPVPAAASTGNVVVSIGGVNSNGVLYTVTPGPNIASVNPTSGSVGTSVTISGAGFGASQGTSSITFNGVAAIPTGWNDTGIVAPVPTGATTGNIVVTVNGIASNSVPFTVSAGAPIKLVQHTSKDAGSTTSSTLAFTSNNTAGNFIAVVIRAGKAGQVFTISDSRGNAYKKAVSFNMTVDADTLGIYYAENIAGGANTVTVSDSILGTLRFAILEYSGVTLANSLDVLAVAEGFGNAASSGNLVPSLSGELLLGGIVTADSESFTAGVGFKIEDSVPAAGSAKLITEDQVQSTVSAVAATASLGSTDPWASALVAFKSLAGAPPPPISVSVSPANPSVGTGGVQNFTATLQSDFGNKGVTWSLSGAGCSGSACGTLTNITPTTVTYTGPGSVPNPATVTLTATSVADTTKNGKATITVVLGPLTVSVTPKRAAVTMSASQTVQFTGNVVNDPSNSGLVWSVDNNNGGTAASGTVSSTGLYTPGTQPGVHTVTATSVANASVSASATVAVTDLAGVYTYHNDVQRTGQNLKEYALTPASVGSSSFTKLFSCPTDGYVYAQPLWVANLTVGGVNRNVVYVATEHDSVYAYDADSSSCILLWKVNFLGSGVTTMPYTDIPSFTDDVFPEIGITSTPVIDPATNTIYVEAKTKETVGTGCSSGSPCYVHRLHALDIITGSEKFGGPKVISANGFSTFLHFNRPALLLANGTVYVAFGSHGDNCNWQGWIFGFNASTLAQNFVWNTTNPNTCNGGAIWQGGAGPAADASGNIYFSTGNGLYDGTNNFSDSTLKLSPTGSLLDWFTPFNQATFQANDIDLASAGVIILPDSVGSTTHPTLAVATGKVAILYLLDVAAGHAMGKFHSNSNSDVQEVIPVPPPNTTQLDGGNYGIPAYWNGNIYSTGQSFPLSQFHISNGVIATPQFAQSANLFPPRGATPTVSANNNSTGIVWVLDLSAWPSSGSAILDAYDATNVSTMLFSSPSSGAASAGPSVKFTVPTVANGKVYVPGQSVITVFGLLPN